MANLSYDTVTEALEELAKRGYTMDFELMVDTTCLICHTNSKQLSPDEFVIDETHRFEGSTDPGDEMIVYAISSETHNLKGIVVNAYGLYSNSETYHLMQKIAKRKGQAKPIKRNESIKPFSREHHQGLLLCWKIRTGIKKEIPAERIKKYINWFYEAQLKPHFEAEESLVFPILPADNELVLKAIKEHRQLQELVEETENLELTISNFHKILEGHIRFEERSLFALIQENATPEQLAHIDEFHNEVHFEENLSDPFWL